MLAYDRSLEESPGDRRTAELWIGLEFAVSSSPSRIRLKTREQAERSGDRKCKPRNGQPTTGISTRKKLIETIEKLFERIFSVINTDRSRSLRLKNVGTIDN